MKTSTTYQTSDLKSWLLFPKLKVEVSHPPSQCEEKEPESKMNTTGYKSSSFLDCLHPAHCALHRRCSHYTGPHPRALPHLRRLHPLSSHFDLFPLIRHRCGPQQAHLHLHVCRCVRADLVCRRLLSACALFPEPSTFLPPIRTGLTFNSGHHQYLQVFLSHFTTIIPSFRHISKFIQ